MVERLSAILLLALVAGLPFELYFRGRGAPLQTSLKLQLAAFLAAWVVAAIVRARREGLRRTARGLAGAATVRVLAAVALFIAMQALSAALAVDERGNALRAALKWLLGVVVFVASADLAARRLSVAAHLLAALAATGAATSLVGLGDWLGIDACRRIAALFQPEMYHVGGFRRLSYTMEYPTTAASFLSASLFASLALLSAPGAFRRSARVVTLASGAAAIVLGLALVLTFSRGAAIAVAVGLAAATWLWRRSIDLAGWKLAAGLGLALLIIVENLLLVAPPARIDAPPPRGARRLARFGGDAAAEVQELSPGRTYRQKIAVRNESYRVWLQGGYGLAYRWYSIATETRGPLREGASFAEDVPVGQEREIEAELTTPREDGEYLLIWFIAHRDPLLQEIDRMFAPAVLCRIHAADAPVPELSERARDYLQLVRQERRGLTTALVPGRWDLWSAAWRIFLERPLLGLGPDSFRLLKWRYMPIPKGDETILTNSLYLEILSGSGILGFAALVWLLAELGLNVLARLRRAPEGAVRAGAWFGTAFFVAYLVHGVVDYFLKFTPTFLLFWIAMGVFAARRREAEPDADRV